MANTTPQPLESRAYINGAFVDSLTQPAATIDVNSTSTGKKIGFVEVASELDVHPIHSP